MRPSFQHIVIGVLLVGCGVIIALSIESIRYSRIVEPTMFGMEPRDVYAAIQTDTDGYRFLDVRFESEYEKLHAEYSTNQPIHTLFDLWRDLPRDKDTEIYLICSGGRLAGVAYGFLQLHGFTNIIHVTGGIQNWVTQDLPTVSPSLFESTGDSL